MLSEIAVDSSLRLAGICSCVRVKCLTTDGIPGNGSVHLNLLLSQLHGAKNNRKLTALMGSEHVVGLTIVWVVQMENEGEALIKPIDEIVANRNWEANVLAERANCVHGSLVVQKDRGSYEGTITIFVSLMNKFKCGMGLVGVAGADLMKDGGAVIWPSKLLDLPFNLKADLKCISVCRK